MGISKNMYGACGFVVPSQVLSNKNHGAASLKNKKARRRKNLILQEHFFPENG